MIKRLLGILLKVAATVLALLLTIKIMEKLKKLGCITIEDYIAHKTEFTDDERVEIKRKIFFNM